MIDVLLLITYVFVGIFAGVCAGLLGISGGLVTVPLLFLLFQLKGFPEGFTMQIAIGTSLASMLFNALSSTWAHAKRQGVMWQVVRQMAPGIVVGSIVGGFVADRLSSHVLEAVFGLCAIALGIYFFRRAHHEGQTRLPSAPFLSLCGAVIAALSNVLGIGGGILTVPLLLHYHVPERKAIGTSAPTGFIVTLFGALAYLYFGAHKVPYPYMVGYIYLPAFALLSISTFLAAPYGASLAHRCPPRILRRLFGVILLLTGLYMLLY